MAVLSKAEELTRDEAEKVVGSTPEAKGGVQTLPMSLIGNEAAGVYPYIDSIAWIDDDGVQKVRFGRTLSPLKDVSARTYFKLAKSERTWTVTLPGDPPIPYVLDWVRSKATGEVRAMLAKKTEKAEKWDKTHKPLSVIAMATQLIDVSEAVRPPGAEMAIIDEDGDVIYHSDTQRIGFENFFTETDRNRTLRSAVVARRAGHVDATYWGDDQSMYVLPLNGSQWTLVTFRAKRLTRVLNVEATLLTLSLLLLSATPYFLVYLAVLLLRPRYRAPRLWPDQTRHGDYLRLSFMLLALLRLFCLNNYALAPWASFCRHRHHSPSVDRDDVPRASPHRHTAPIRHRYRGLDHRHVDAGRAHVSRGDPSRAILRTCCGDRENDPDPGDARRGPADVRSSRPLEAGRPRARRLAKPATAIRLLHSLPRLRRVADHHRRGAAGHRLLHDQPARGGRS